MYKGMEQAVRRGVGQAGAALKPRLFGTSENLVEIVTTEFDRRAAERKPWELQWRLNMDFVDGKQYMEINQVLEDVAELPRLFWWQEREVFNHTGPVLETRVARLRRMAPKLVARPATGEREDLAGARVSTRLMDFIDRERMTPEAKQNLYALVETCGTAFLRNIWNYNIGRVVGYQQMQVEEEAPDQIETYPEQYPRKEEGLKTAGAIIAQTLRQRIEPSPKTVMVERGDIGARALSIVPVYDGDIDPEVISPFEIYPDSPWHPTMDDVRSLLHSRAYHVDEIYEDFGVRVEPSKDAPGVGILGMENDAQAYGGLGYGVGGFHRKVYQRRDYALVHNFWVLPSVVYPNGQLVVVVGNKVVERMDKLPYNVGPDNRPGLPFTRFVSIQRPICFWGRTVIDRIVPIQRSYNAIRNRKREYMTRVAIGQLLAEEGSLVDALDVEENGGAPGAIIYYKKGTMRVPEFLTPQVWPTALENEDDTLLNEIAILSGVSETTSRSQAPSGVKSGVALSILVEQDDTRLSITAANFEAGWVNAGKQWLRLCKQFVDMPRLLKTVGRDRSVDVAEWDGSDIRSDDVVVQTTAMMSDSPAQRRQFIYELFNMKMFHDPVSGLLTRAGRNKVFELLEFGDWETGNDLDDLHASRAEKENRLVVMQQQVMMPNMWDDDFIHLENHIRYMLEDRFEEANIKSGGILQVLIEQHMQMHVVMIQAKGLAPQLVTTTMPGAQPAPQGTSQAQGGSYNGASQ
jgi:hypothetical protein